MVGCSKYTGPYRICLENHTELYTQMVPIGKTMIPQTRTRNVCDKYTEQEYIKVDKVVYEVKQIWKE